MNSKKDLEYIDTGLQGHQIEFENVDDVVLEDQRVLPYAATCFNFDLDQIKGVNKTPDPKII